MAKGIADLLTPPKKDRLGDKIAADIKRLIFSEKIEPGQKLPSERELARILQVSRVAVRDALRILEQSGLVEVTGSPRGGAVATHNLHKPISGSLTDLYESGQLTLEHFIDIRRAIECLLIRLASEKASPSDLNALEEINRRILDDVDDPVGFRRDNKAFHIKLAELAGNPLGVLIVRSLFDIMETVRSSPTHTRDFIERTYEHHQAVLTALQSRNPSHSAEAMAVDVEYTKSLIEEADVQRGRAARDPEPPGLKSKRTARPGSRPWDGTLPKGFVR